MRQISSERKECFDKSVVCWISKVIPNSVLYPDIVANIIDPRVKPGVFQKSLTFLLQAYISEFSLEFPLDTLHKRSKRI